MLLASYMYDIFPDQKLLDVFRQVEKSFSKEIQAKNTTQDV